MGQVGYGAVTILKIKGVKELFRLLDSAEREYFAMA